MTIVGTVTTARTGTSRNWSRSVPLAVCACLVADESALILKSVKNLIEQEPAWVIAGQAANGREVIEEKVSELNPDLVALQGLTVLLSQQML